jgi:CheY-like chemotaxis protein
MQATTRILITDDNKDFRLSLCEGLQRRGFATLEAADGLEALSMIAAVPVDMLIADVHMPNLDGIEMLAKLRRQPHHLPCILMSAAWDVPLKASALSLAPELVVEKPFRIAAIVDSINRILATRSN